MEVLFPTGMRQWIFRAAEQITAIITWPLSFVSASNPPLECTPDGASWKTFCSTPILAIFAACK